MHWPITAPVFRSFKNRLLILIVGLIGLAQSATLLLALGYLHRDVYHTANQELHTAQELLQHQLQLRDARMLATAAALISDFGFKEAVASGDNATIRSALANQAGRIGAALAMVYTPDGQLIADTGDGPSRSHQVMASLVHAAIDEDTQGPEPFYAVLDGQPMQIVLTPLRAPVPIAWVVFGFALDAEQEKSFSALVRTQVRFVMTPMGASGADVQLVEQDGMRFLALATPLPSRDGVITMVILKSYFEAMAAFREVRDALLITAALALVAAIGIALAAGRSAARPVEALSAAVRRIESGSYDEPVRLRGASEFKQLARSFNGMQIGLRDREQRIRYQTMHDALTGLRSRVGLRQRLTELMEEGRAVAIVLLDVHRFRDVNASLDRDTADAALRAVATRLAHVASSADLAGRLGADQFALVLETAEIETATQLALRLADDLRGGVQVADARLALTTRSGVSCTSLGARTADDLMRQADVALLEAKERGLAVACYEAGHDAQHRRSVLLVADLRRAIVQGGLSVAYQPVVRISNGELTHFEALVRWTHPTLGAISPAEFVPLAERASVVAELTHWVISAVTEQLRGWQQTGQEMTVAINLSATDVADLSLPAFIFSKLSEGGVSARQLIFEVTESAIMREPQAATRVMEQLRAAGSRFAIDDFGTGHSSLTQVHSLPVDELKIDRAFVRDMERSERSAMIVRTVIELAHGLRLAVVAEGIETPDAMALLLKMGCEYAQGYMISRPMPAESVLTWLEARRADLQAITARAREAGALIELRSVS